MDIVVAVDGSAESDRALEHAVTLAEGMGGSITAVHAVDPTVDAEGTPGRGSDGTDVSDFENRIVASAEDAEDEGIELLEGIEARLETDVPVETELLYGDPREEIAAFAVEAGADAIVVGHRSRSERAERLLGSVAKGLLERAEVPVTVVR